MEDYEQFIAKMEEQEEEYCKEQYYKEKFKKRKPSWNQKDVLDNWSLAIYEDKIKKTKSQTTIPIGLISDLRYFKRLLESGKINDYDYDNKRIKNLLWDFFYQEVNPYKQVNTHLKVKDISSKQTPEEIKKNIQKIAKQKKQLALDQYLDPYQRYLKRISKDKNKLIQEMKWWLDFFNRSEIIKKELEKK